jgi:hypothetical protein
MPVANEGKIIDLASCVTVVKVAWIVIIVLLRLQAMGSCYLMVTV